MQSCLKFSAVLRSVIVELTLTYLGVMSLKSSVCQLYHTIASYSPILMRPAGVSPMVISKKTIGRVTPAGASSEEDMIAGESRMLTKVLASAHEVTSAWWRSPSSVSHVIMVT